jgi:Zn-dependent protease
MADVNVLLIALNVGFLVLSLGVHEASHAWVAYLCGDPTAKEEGRLTLNPLAHLDPFLSVILPALLYVFTGFMFGGARPVPIVASRMRHPMRGLMLSALAGPGSNFLLAVLFLLCAKILVYGGGMGGNTVAVKAMQGAEVTNLVLAAFNMIPIPPLDGSRVLAFFLPGELRRAYMALERFGLFIVFGLLYTGITGRIIGAAIDPMISAAEFLTGGYWR